VLDTADYGRAVTGVPAGFDALLRARRVALGFTQAELAARARVGVRTVRDLELGRASRPQRTTVDLLADALQLTGQPRTDFVAAARGRPAPARPAPTVQLPPATVLIGRGRELADIVALIGAEHGPRCVTLVGIAGVGKTALAFAAGHRVAQRYAGGIGGVTVTEVSTPADVLITVAAVFGLGRSAELADRFVREPGLVVIDAVERAPDAVAEALQHLAEQAPGLRFLATGRHPVGLPDERVLPLGPLDVPPEDAPPETIGGYPAVALFTERLARVRPGPPAEAELPALLTLVRRLGGLPLALELAAARGRVLTTGEILDRYGDRVLDLASLRDAVTASYLLLAEPDRRALRLLAVFRNRWSVELAERLLAAAGVHTDPVSLLDRLLELGLLAVRGTGPFRFRLVDAVRDVAAERAAEQGEVDESRRLHATALADLAERIAPDLAGPRLPEATARLDDLTADLGAALGWAAAHDPHTALRLAAALPRWWRYRGRDRLGRQWLHRLLGDPRTADAAPALRAWARLGLARLALAHGAGADEYVSAAAALAEFDRLGDVAGQVAAHTLLAELSTATGRYDDARRHGTALLALAHRDGRLRDVAIAENALTSHDIRLADLPAARRRLATADRLAAQSGDQRLRALILLNLADVARLDGAFDDAQAYGRRAAAALVGCGDLAHRRRALGTAGTALAEAGRLVEAEEVLAALRGTGPGDADGPAAMVAAMIALRRGDREQASTLFGAAARRYEDGPEPRSTAEALMWLATCTDGDIREVVLRCLTKVCQANGIALLPRERERIGPLG
jgi:predicted ATPase/transcriptional regulator with XRE-family HTH domain